MSVQAAWVSASPCSWSTVSRAGAHVRQSVQQQRVLLSPFLGFKVPQICGSPSLQRCSFVAKVSAMERVGGFLSRLALGSRAAVQTDAGGSSIAQGPDYDVAAPGQEFATFGAGCFWGVELVFQRVPGVSKTEVGYTQGQQHQPTYSDVCSGSTGHSEVVRVQFDPKECSYGSLLDIFWKRHDPTTLNRQGGDVGTQYRSGIYFYTPKQEKAAKETMELHQKSVKQKVVTEILPAKKFYRAEEYHQQYLAKGGRFGFRQSTEKGCNDPIRCYG